jgi:hypothetical protein
MSAADTLSGAGVSPGSPQDEVKDLPARREARRRSALLVAAEILVVVLWTMLVTRPYLDLNPGVTPAGREYLSGIQTHYFWTRVTQCGWCALWNGSGRGGAPALVDPHGSMLHPLVIVPTLLLGVLNGSKLALVGAFLMAGLAQWGIARVLGLGSVARVWSAAMAVSAGHLAGRMELGAFGVVLSTAACALVIPPLLALNRGGSRRAPLWLGIALAFAIVAGQGYMQIGLLFTLPAAIFLLPRDRAGLRRVVRGYGLAILLALLLAAPFLAPFLHFVPEFGKQVDPTFGSVQPLAYIPLNLVINDYAFFGTEALGKLSFPHLNVNYVGWVAVVLALVGVFKHRTRLERQAVLFFTSSAFLAMWVASAEPLRWLVKAVPLRWLVDQLAGIRHPAQIAGLAVPCVLALAAIGLDVLMGLSWPKLRLVLSSAARQAPFLSIDSRWLLFAVLFLALLSTRQFGTRWIAAIPLAGTKIASDISDVVDALRTPDLQWVNTPFGEHYWTVPALDAGLKLAGGIQTWFWKDRPNPAPVLEANRLGPPPGMTAQATVRGIPIYLAPPGREYATVTHGDGARSVCAAHGIGGSIDVSCSLAAPGVLTVLENNWTGWRAEIDGRPARLRPERWLSVELPAGVHTVHLGYFPWDVPLGLALSLVGVGLAIVLFVRGPRLTGDSGMQKA